MVIVTLTDCPPKLRGDMTRWLMEINTGVYVGKISARVREELWKRICDNIGSGRATMVFSAKNEQGFSFYVHNTSWEPVDFEGIRLMRRPASVTDTEYTGMEAAERKLHSRVIARKTAAVRNRKRAQEGYCVIDVETTGLEYQKDDIIEIAAIRIVNHQMSDQISLLIRVDRKVPPEISRMTGITDEMVQKEGVSLWEAIEKFRDFIGLSPVVSHNISFDRSFLSEAFMRLGEPPMRNICKDTLALAKRRIDDIRDYKLETIAEYYHIEVKQKHRALADCITTFQVYEKLNEI